MKRLFIFIIAIALMLGLASCSPEPETIEGYWMAENGETISFTSEGKAIIDDLALDYSIYDENNLSIYFLGFALEFKFEIEKDTLTLIDLSDDSSMTYYRNETKQAEIKENLNKIAAEKAEQERIQQELEAQAQAKLDYENHIAKLKKRIESIDQEIPRIQGYISDNEGYISNSEENIQAEINKISELEKQIVQMQYQIDEESQWEIEYIRGTQEYHYGNIDFYNGEIEYYNNEINRYKNNISDLETEKEEIIKELNELGEY